MDKIWHNEFRLQCDCLDATHAVDIGVSSEDNICQLLFRPCAVDLLFWDRLGIIWQILFHPDDVCYHDFIFRADDLDTLIKLMKRALKGNK